MVSRASMIAIIVQVPLQRERGATRRVARRGGDGEDGCHAHQKTRTALESFWVRPYSVTVDTSV